MKVKNINTSLLIFIILTSCAPSTAVVSPTETAVPMSTVTTLSSTATAMPTRTPENLLPTSEPTASLSREGPWLLYVHNSPSPGMMDRSEVPPEFILLNQDGSGFTPIVLDGNVDHFLDGPNSANYMAGYAGRMYLFRPSKTTGMVICGMMRNFCFDRFFTNNEKGGLLASIYQAADDAVPELRIYELPGGRIRDRFPLVKCEKDVNACEKIRSMWEDSWEPKPEWSPNGRYLAFAVYSDESASDLFVYDSLDGGLRRLTHGPDWVGPIEWSPDGTQIIMQELRDEDIAYSGPSLAVPSSVWSVSVSTSEIKLLYLTGAAYMQQDILRWLDDKRFIAYEGSLLDPMSGALNLRFVDMDAGTSRMLFDDWFVIQSFDPIHETLAISKQITEKSPEGIFLASIKTGTLRRLEEPPYAPDFQWDPATGLFVSSYDCQNDPQSLQAFDYQGNFSCVPKQTPTPDTMEIASYLAPNGKWNISVKDGLWLETESKPAIQVSPETASDVIWCPDSGCFFFSVLQQNQQWTLYRVSLPDLTIKMVDEGIQSTGSYQWLGGEQ